MAKAKNTNQQILLGHVLEQQRKKRAPEMSADDYFEVFVAEQLLKKYDLSDEEISSGLVDGGDDGGIDAFYTFVNEELLQEDSDLSDHAKKGVKIDVIIIQSKTTPSFSETAVDKIHHTLKDLLDLEKPLKSIAGLYNADVRAAAELFRKAVQQLASSFPELSIAVSYATQGVDVHPKVTQKAKKVEGMLKELYPASSSSMTLIPADDLYDLAQQGAGGVSQLIVTEKLDSSSGGIAALVKLTEYVKFISDEKKRLRRHLFEANVRDYQGKVEVNKEIQECLTDHWSEEFWWLNNGITIVAAKVEPIGKTLTMEDPQIVNGLQTSREIHRYFETGNTTNEDREILVRIIRPKNAESRDRVIKATNSQTAIAAASLRATDEIQRNIEHYLKTFGLYYDRRKNFYKNEGKPRSKIISIPAMAQALMAIMLQVPDTARARPSSLLKKDEDYEKVFNDAYPIQVFRACLELTRAAEEHLLTDGSLSKEDRVNLRFYVAMHLAATLCKAAKPTPQQIKDLEGKPITGAALTASATIVKALYKKLGGDSNVAKGNEFREQLIQALEKDFPPQGAAAKKKGGP